MKNTLLNIGACLLLGVSVAVGCDDDEDENEGLEGMEVTATQCQDGQDNDGDGQVDCADADCEGFVFCADAGTDADSDSDSDSDLSCDDPIGSDAIEFDYAKLLIEHNATDEDTGFQGAADGSGWNDLLICGPDGAAFYFGTRGEMRELGITELFYETEEPLNSAIPIPEVLGILPEGDYVFRGESADGQEMTGETALTHAVPKGPVLIEPADDAVVSADEDLVFSWEPVTETIEDEPVTITHYQLIVELANDEIESHAGWGRSELSMHVPATTTTLRVPSEFLEPGSPYEWEVLAIEQSGNQTLSARGFETQ
jgi:hypothetical protein